MLEFLQKLSEPHPSIVSVYDRQKAQLSSSLILVFVIFMFILGIVIAVAQVLGFNENNKMGLPIIWIADVFYFGIYFLSRTRYNRGAVYLLLFVISLGIVSASILSSASIVIAITYSAVIYLIASILLSDLATLSFTILSVLEIISIYIFGYLTLEEFVGISILLSCTGSLSYLSATLQKSFLKRAERAEIQANNNLEQIRSMLHTMKDGMFTVKEGLVVEPNYSTYLETIIGEKDIKLKSLNDILLSKSILSNEQKQIISNAFELCIGSDAINFEANKHLIPSRLELKISGKIKIVDITCSPVVVGYSIAKMLVVLKDVSLFEELKKKSEDTQQEMHKIFKILSLNHFEFAMFIEDSKHCLQKCDEIIKRSDNIEDNLIINSLLRYLHTFKGNARISGFLDISEQIHQIESSLKEGLHAVQPMLNKLALEIDEYKRIYNERIKSFLSVNDSSLDIHKTFKQVISTVADDLPNLAETLKKLEPKVHIKGENIKIPIRYCSLLKNIFIHLVGNSMDHGIEFENERNAKGKEVYGNIYWECHIDNERLIIRFRDDGRGLNYQKIFKKAISEKRIAAVDQENISKVLHCIFLPSFSTKESASAISGRGIGLDAVKFLVEQHGGKIEIYFDTSNEDQFYPVIFAISLPIT